MVVLYIRDHGGLGFLAKKFTQKPTSQRHPDTLAVLIRYNQAQKCLQYASNKLLQNLRKNYSMEFFTD